LDLELLIKAYIVDNGSIFIKDETLDIARGLQLKRFDNGRRKQVMLYIDAPQDTAEAVEQPLTGNKSEPQADITPLCKHGFDMCPMSVFNRNCDTCRVDTA
jgi:hypothetical protein